MYANVGILAADPCSQGRGRRCPPTRACLPGRAVIYGATPFDRAVNSRTRDGMFRRSRLIDKHRPGTPGRGSAMLRGRASALGVNCRCGERTASRRGGRICSRWSFQVSGFNFPFLSDMEMWAPLGQNRPVFLCCWRSAAISSCGAANSMSIQLTPPPFRTGDIRLLHSSRNLFF